MRGVEMEGAVEEGAAKNAAGRIVAAQRWGWRRVWGCEVSEVRLAGLRIYAQCQGALCVGQGNRRAIDDAS